MLSPGATFTSPTSGRKVSSRINQHLTTNDEEIKSVSTLYHRPDQSEKTSHRQDQAEEISDWDQKLVKEQKQLNYIQEN